ncbi:peptidyl-prolyl cis-trans isomerase [Pseudoponticoccus marisrubri]|uniref:Parvulin-like PPIase n=1 Tax=Pseudoponticoccus marisrubri TaxID=1685382 RepID=A0A0W7WLZ3_9RHOB|nr:peptidyl-prolyl cis-trans isomerase [Pseudoponticoccus marisrubri]KUF11613.1 peptidylprolyl isomerase [Pseudoponticoccus marisrubri]
MAAKSGSMSKTLVWILMALLILGLAGFGATNFGGSVRSIGRVGEAEIDVTDYARALQNEIRAVEAQRGRALSFQEAQNMGLTQDVLSRMVVTAALEHEAAQLGLSVGDEQLAQDLRNIQAFQGPDGSFNRDAYRLALQNAGLSEREFEEQLRAESASTLLQGAVLAGTTLPDTYIDTLLDYANQRRAFTWAELGQDAFDTGVPVPEEGDLKAWYDENIDRFTRPRTTQITYAWLTPEMIVDSVEVDEETLRAAYDEQFDRFNLPERRLVERLVFADEAAARDALARVQSGEAAFEDLVEARGLDIADTDMGDVAREDLGGAADTVFEAEVGSVTGPAPTELGPALFRVNAVLPAQSTSFEDAIPDLRGALALDRARRVIETQAQSYDDELAAGATLEELAETTDLQLGQIGWTGQNDSGIAGYEAFREAAAALEEGDFPQIEQLGDGGVFALRFEEVLPPQPIPMDEVNLQVLAGWQDDQKTEALMQQAEQLAARLAEGATFEGVGLEANTEAGLTRTAFGADLPEGLLERVFELEPGQTAALPGDATAYVLRLDEILPVDRDSETSQQLTRIFGDQAASDVSQDLFRALSSDIQSRAGVVIDQAAINAVHANFQ